VLAGEFMKRPDTIKLKLSDEKPTAGNLTVAVSAGHDFSTITLGKHTGDKDSYGISLSPGVGQFKASGLIKFLTEHGIDYVAHEEKLHPEAEEGSQFPYTGSIEIEKPEAIEALLALDQSAAESREGPEKFIGTKTGHAKGA